MASQSPRLGVHLQLGDIGPVSLVRALLERERIVLLGLLALAAATRLPGLATRGRWGSDQGDHLMTMWRWTHDGIFPLLGSPGANNSIHHGAGWYFYLLGPVAFLSGTDPGALVWIIAVFGIATVAVVWWLASEIGGRLAGLLAGLFVVVSPTAIEGSTFLWNPNLVPFFAGLAVACAWHAHRTGHVRWWVAALASSGMLLQLHLLGVILLPPIVALLALDLRHARRADHVDDGDRSRRLLLAGLAGAALIAALFLPWLVSELQTGFAETQGLLAYLRSSGGAEQTTLSAPARLALIVLRSISWPLVGLITDAPIAATLAAALVIGLAAWRVLAARGHEGIAVQWLTGTLAWSSLALTFAAPSLQSVVVGLPNDHYHAFLDPIVIVLLAVGAAGLARAMRSPGSARTGVALGRTVRGLVAVSVVALLVVGMTRWPAAVDPNGGWPAARMAGVQIVETTGPASTVFLGLPRFETADGVVFPFVYAGGNLATDPGSAQFIVVPCDHLFDQVMGTSCGGAAEDRLIDDLAAGRVTPFLKAGEPPYPALDQVPQLVERFNLSPRTSISIYRK